MKTLEEHMQNLSLGRSKDLSLVASIREYGGPKTSKESIQDFFEQIEQYGRINNWTGHDLVAIAISKLTDEAALFIKGLDQPEQQDLTYDRLKELLTKRFLDRLPLQYYYTLLHEARQEKTQTPTQFLDRLRNTSAKTIRKGSTPAECTLLIEDGRYEPLSALTHGCLGPVRWELRFRMPESIEQALNIATTVYNAFKMKGDPRGERNYRPDVRTIICYGCNKTGHIKKDCRAYREAH